MLDAASRLTSADDYRRVVRRGRRAPGSVVLAHVVMNPNGGKTRFGFIVAKTVGGAVTRNRVRRRLKALAYEMSADVPTGTELVFRAMPPAASASFDELRNDVSSVVARARQWS